jgi:hypothetical protein
LIGRLKSGFHVLTLEDDLTWTCPTMPTLASLYALAFDRDDYPGPQAGAPGPYLFYLAVREMKADIVDAPEPDPPEPERVY